MKRKRDYGEIRNVVACGGDIGQMLHGEDRFYNRVIDPNDGHSHSKLMMVTIEWSGERVVVGPSSPVAWRDISASNVVIVDSKMQHAWAVSLDAMAAREIGKLVPLTSMDYEISRLMCGAQYRHLAAVYCAWSAWIDRNWYAGLSDWTEFFGNSKD